MQGGAVYGSVRNFVKASRLPLTKVRQFLHSKLSHTKFTPATRIVQRMKAFPRFKSEIWCIDLAYVDELANNNNGVEYLLTHRDLFDGTVDSKKSAQKIPMKRFVHF